MQRMSGFVGFGWHFLQIATVDTPETQLVKTDMGNLEEWQFDMGMHHTPAAQCSVDSFDILNKEDPLHTMPSKEELSF